MTPLSLRRLLVLGALLTPVPATAQLLLPGGEFDTASDVAGWTAGDFSTVSWNEEDPYCPPSQPSGILRLFTSEGPSISASRCVALEGATEGHVGVQAWIEGCDHYVDSRLEFFSDAECGGTELGTEVTFGGLNCQTWDFHGSSFVVPDGAISARLTLGVSVNNQTDVEARFDSVRLTTEWVLQTSGFEGGGFCRWEPVVAN